MSTTPPIYRSDIKPVEFILAIFIGSIGSMVLSWLHVHALWSVGFAVMVMSLLAILRWRIASERTDYQSLEAFAEDIYLLGYLLTLAALLGLAPRLMAEDTNLFNIAGVKLVTTVFGLALMMVFRQTARRWAEEKQGEETQKFIEQQRLFSDAVARLNEGADQLTAKLDEVVRRFDPALLEPLADWSNKAAGAFSLATSHLESVPPSVLNGIRHLDALNSNLEQLKTTAVELSGVLTAGTAKAASVLAAELAQASQATSALGSTVGALQPAGEAARLAIEKLGSQANIGVTQFTAVSDSLNSTALELAKVESALKKLRDLHDVDANLPMNRLVDALDKSTANTSIASERVVTLNDGLHSFAAAGEEVAKRIETQFGTPLAAHQEALGGVQQHMIRAAEQFERVAKQIESAAAIRPDGESSAQLMTQLSGMKGEMSQTNSHLKTLLARIDGSPGPEHKPGFLERFFGGGATGPTDK